jgi:peptidoglycan endopeptidase LytF
MNTPNPLVPQGTFADKGKAHIRNTVFVILAGHLVLLVGLLFAGCNKKDADMAGGDSALPQTPTALTPDWPTTPPVPSNQAPAVAITPQSLAPGQPIVATHPTPPQLPAAVETPTPAGFTEHTILKGETFSSIGQKYKVGYQAIAAANPGVDPSRLNIGQKIKIPPPRTMVANARTTPGAATGAADNGGEKIYTVKSGDNLYTLARTYGVTAKEIQAANNLNTTRITVGQKLKIPSKAPPAEATAPPPATPPATPALPTDGAAPSTLVPR